MPRGDLLSQLFPLRLVPAGGPRLVRFPRKRRHPHSEHFQNGAGNPGECPRLVLLPIPIGGQLRQASIARLAFAQLGGAFLDGLFQHHVEVLEPLVQQTHFQHVADARLDFDEVERLADEILGARLQRSQLVSGLRRQHDDRQVAVGGIRLQAFHHVKAVETGHLEVEQYQVVAVPAMQRADLERIHRRTYARIAGLAQQLREQADVGFLVVDDQDVGVEDLLGVNRHAWSPGSRGPCRYSQISARRRACP